MKRIVVAVSGASGAIYTERFLVALPLEYEIHLLISQNARIVFQQELGWDHSKKSFLSFMAERGLAADCKVYEYNVDNLSAAISSGSFRTEAMVVIPCSAKTLAGIAVGYGNNLIERAAAVHLKEQRPLILLLREAPYNRVHLKNMLTVNDAGATVVPASPAFYHGPQTITDLADFIVARIFNLLKIDQELFKGWGE